MYQNPSLQILKFNLRPDLYAHVSWLQNLATLQQRTFRTNLTSGIHTTSNHNLISDRLAGQGSGSVSDQSASNSASDQSATNSTSDQLVTNSTSDQSATNSTSDQSASNSASDQSASNSAFIQSLPGHNLAPNSLAPKQLTSKKLLSSLHGECDHSLKMEQLRSDQHSKSNLNFVFAEYLLKRYGLYKNYCWHFDTPLENLALQHHVYLLNNYIIALMYCTQIRRAITRSDYCTWLALLTEPVMNFALFKAPYLPTHDLPDLAVRVDYVEKQLPQIMKTSMGVIKYLFHASPSIWLRVKLHFPQQIFLHKISMPDLTYTNFYDWLVHKIVKQEMDYVIH